MPSRDVAAAARGMLAPMIASMFEARDVVFFTEKCEAVSAQFRSLWFAV
jgi:hypothetical protein